MKKLTILILVLCLVFSLFSCGTRGNGDSSETPEGSGTGGNSTGDGSTEPPPTKEYIDAAVGHYEIELDGMNVNVDFWSIPPQWYQTPYQALEGTLTYTNNTGTALTRYLLAGFDIHLVQYDSDDVAYSDTPEIEQSTEYETLTNETPILLTLDPGETVTINFSVAYPEQLTIPDCEQSITFGLSESESFHSHDLSYRLCFHLR